MHFWTKRVVALFGGRKKALSMSLQSKLASGQASDLRIELQAAYTDHPDFSVGVLIAQARQAGWSDLELEKLAIYAEIFSGQTANAWHRLMLDANARLDFDLFMTAISYCYLHDRFVEGYQLLQCFELEHAQRLDLSEYYPCAAYATFNGGGTVQAAAAYLVKALDEGLLTPLIVVNAYVIFFEAGKLDRLAELHQLIQQRYLNDIEAVYTIAYVELARDYYAEGFRLMEARYRRSDTVKMLSPTLQRSPRWQQEALKGKRIFIHGEQGIGDVLMMSRYLPMLEQAGAMVILECPDPARSLMAHNFPGCELIGLQVGKQIEQTFDFWTGMMSLPFHFNTTAYNVPKKEGYLTVPTEQSSYWYGRVATENTDRRQPKVGVAWSGNPRHRFDQRRSIAFDKICAFLDNAAEVQFFALQTEVPVQYPANLTNLTEELVTFADTAAIISEMDLVITVDTSIVHLAGALGKETWLLLPYRYEWRWSLQGESNNWYDSVRVIRQTISGRWEDLLPDVFQRRLPDWINRWRAVK